MVRKKQILLFITHILFCVNCFAQPHPIDSLTAILPSLKAKARIDCLNQLGFEYSNRYWSKSKYQQTDTALFYTLLAQNESQQLNYLAGTGKALHNRAMIEEEHGNLKEAENYMRKALAIFSTENMEPEYHMSRVLLGWILHNRGFFSQSIQIYSKEIPYFEEKKDTAQVGSLYRIMARAYDWQGYSEKAFAWFQKDFAISKNTNDAWGKRSSANLKAAVYLAAGDTLTAAYYFKQAAFFALNQKVIPGAYYYNMATFYSLQKQYEAALTEMHTGIDKLKSTNADSLFRKVAWMSGYITLTDLFLLKGNFDSVIFYGLPALAFFTKGDCVTSMLPLLTNLAVAYKGRNEYSRAMNYTKQLVGLAQRSGARRFERDGYKLQGQIYSGQHKTNLAEHVQLKYFVLNDSLEKDKYISQAAAWQAINDRNAHDIKIRNQLEINKVRSNEQIQFISREKKTQLKWFIAAFAMMILFIMLIIRNNRLKRKKGDLQLMMTKANLLLEKQNQEQDIVRLQQQKTDLEMQALRAQMNPHFIFNCLSSINRYILINKTEEASDYLTKFSRLIRMALHNSEKSFIDLENELEALRLYIDLERLRFKNSFNYSIRFINEIELSAVFIPPMLIQPFVENAIWHGLMHRPGTGCLDITLRIEEKILTCIIADDGIGRYKAAMMKSKSAEKNKSMGLKITRERLELLKRNKEEQAAINIEDLTDQEGNASGTKVVLKLKYRSLIDTHEYQK